MEVGLSRGFFAYPSTPRGINEIVTDAAERINAESIARVVIWPNLRIGGKLIWPTIEKEIDGCDFFVADLTNLNHNVIFELGYAIARQKRIWCVVNGHAGDPRLTTTRSPVLRHIGYRTYNNSQELFQEFIKDSPHTDTNHSLYSELVRSDGRERKLLYLKGALPTQASRYLTELVDSIDLPVFTDDPIESPDQPLNFYFPELCSASAVLVHFLPSTREDFYMHNAKCSLLAGVAFGLNKPLLMLADEPFNSPVDYQDLLRVHDTGEKCVNFAKPWLAEQERSYHAQAEAHAAYRERKHDYEELQTLYLGTYAAENERDTLDDYFVETGAFTEGLNAQSALYVGRRGSGKTATFLRIADSLRQKKQNLVVEIFPRDYELDGLLEVFSRFAATAERGFLAESLWKFLLYSEIAKAAYESLLERPTHLPCTERENALVQFVELNRELVLGPFSARLDKAMSRLKVLGKDADDLHLRVSELLHQDLIQKIRKLLPGALEGKERVVLLVDNLDKSWTPDLNVDELGSLIFGLLNVRQSLLKEFQSGPGERTNISLSVLVFLRSDIFGKLLSLEREADKIEYKTLNWRDQGLLRRIVERRFFSSSKNVDNENGVWYRYFCEKIGPQRTRDYVVETVLPRPRDIVFLSKAALSSAINKGHTLIEEEDILEAERLYSKHALDALLNESRVLYPRLEDFMFDLYGGGIVLSYGDVRSAAETSGVGGQQLELFIEHLVEQWFLSVEVKKGEFKYLYDERDAKRYYSLARRYVQRTRLPRRYEINPVYWQELSLERRPGRLQI